MTNNLMTDLQRKAQKAILDDPRTKEHGIEVQDDNGVITLKGHVPTPAVSQAAESILREFLGIENMINELHIKVAELDDSFKDKVKSR